MFIHLQCHSEFSLLDSPLTIKQIINSAKEFNMPAIALTDNGVLFGAIEFYLTAKANNIKPIIGCELYFTKDINKKERGLDKLILLAKNYQGYQNLIKIVTFSHLHGFYYKPRIDLPLLEKYHENLIAIAPGLKSPIGYQIYKDQLDTAEIITKKLQEIYQEDFYLGISRLGLPGEDTLLDAYYQLQKKYQLKLVATNDIYFLNKESAVLRNILRCIQTGKKLKDTIKDQIQQSEEMYFKTSEEMAKLFTDLPEAIQNTLEIAEKCNLIIETEQVKLPHFVCPDNKNNIDYLKELVFQGLETRYPQINDTILERVNFELALIIKMGFANYFLIIQDFLNYAREKKIPFGPGRGSAAGSLVAYALNITNIDPLRYKLLFERFLNPERISMPDIDLDFCIKRRNEIIDYLLQKYGKDHVAQIITFGTMAARGAIRDVGRVLDVPLNIVDKIAKLIPSSPGNALSIKTAVEQINDLKNQYDDSFEIKELIDYASQVEGLPRHSSMHAAGVVISQSTLDEVVPLIKNEGQITTQFQMTDLEKIGLLKMDILGLRNLTVINDTLERIKKRQNISLDLENLSVDDEKTYALLCEGKTIGVFQLESRGMRELIKKLKPSCFEDLIALLALYRPGPLGSGMVNEFISNKSGETKIKYEIPELEPVLKDTYGLIVYQEQVMQIASIVGGFTLGQADVLRRAMGKKKKEEMDRMKEDFIQGAKNKNISEKKAEKIFDLCYKFAEYGFNKSHSAAYALISYQTAYLKTNYPKEYMASLLSSILASSDKISLYIDELKEMGIKIFSPNINESEFDFTICDEGIKFGLGAIKNVGEGAIENIINQRKKQPFTDLLDFLIRIDLRLTNKRVIESLIKSGALDIFGKRDYLLKIHEKALEYAQIRTKEKNSGQINLFSNSTNMADQYLVPDENLHYSKFDLLKMEKELLGIYISDHPLNFIKEKINGATKNINDIKMEDDQKIFTFIGIFSNIKKTITKNHKEFYAGNLEDLSGEIPIMLFVSERTKKFQPLFANDNIVKIRGKIRTFQEEISLSCEDIQLLDLSNSIKKLHINIDGLDTVLKSLKILFKEYPGLNPVYLHYQNDTILVNKKYQIEYNDEFATKIANLVGKHNLWLV